MSDLYPEGNATASIGLLLKIVHSDSRLLSFEVAHKRYCVRSWPDRWCVKLVLVVEEQTWAEAEDESLGRAAWKVAQEYLKRTDRTVEELLER